LHWGEISARTVWLAASRHGGKGAQTYVTELLWREFCAHLLWHHPTLPDAPLRTEFAAMRWRDDAAGLRAWQRGLTGIPIVDAGMRQLWQTGWQHNRVRMITASFLIKHLLIDWRLGEAWFWDCLVDADLGSNSANWQWVAGSGADASPFFRIFNPWLQGQKFDPDGAYVKQFVPELARVEARYIHAPWEAPGEVLRAAGVELGRDYPARVVDLMMGRERALEAFRGISDKVRA
jgi:deoxyribodipyrimidine photo-lyase